MDPSQVFEKLLEIADSLYPDFREICHDQTPQGGFYLVGSHKPNVITGSVDDPALITRHPGWSIYKQGANLPTSALLPDSSSRCFSVIQCYPSGNAAICGEGVAMSLDQGLAFPADPRGSVQYSGIRLSGTRIDGLFDSPVSNVSSSAIDVTEATINASPALKALRDAMMDYIDSIGADKMTAYLSIVIHGDSD